VTARPLSSRIRSEDFGFEVVIRVQSNTIGDGEQMGILRSASGAKGRKLVQGCKSARVQEFKSA